MHTANTPLDRHIARYPEAGTDVFSRMPPCIQLKDIGEYVDPQKVEDFLRDREEDRFGALVTRQLLPSLVAAVKVTKTQAEFETAIDAMERKLRSLSHDDAKTIKAMVEKFGPDVRQGIEDAQDNDKGDRD